MNKSKQIKVAFVYDAIYPYIKGGAEKRYFELAHEFKKRGYEVHLYGMKFWKGPKVIKKDGIFLHGLCKARPLYSKTGKRKIGQALIFGISCLKLTKEPFDTLDCCGFPYFSIFTCKLITFIRRKALYVTWHEVWGKQYWKEYLGLMGFIGYCIELFASRMPTAFIAVSEHTAHQLKTTLGVKRPVFVIKNGIHVGRIQALPAASEHSDIIYAGRLVHLKHIDVLLKAVAIIKAKKPKLKTLIIGEGPEATRLKLLSRQLNLDKNVTFLPFFDNHSDLLKQMKASKIFALPSTREGFGLVVIEANAAGLTVLTTNAKQNAAKDLIGSTNGLAVELKPAIFAESLTKLLESRKDKLDFTEIIEPYDWKIITNQVEKVIL